jgi:hypothetical protein
MEATDGNFYGTTSSGGCCGAVFRVTPDVSESIVYFFKGKADGGAPAGGDPRERRLALRHNGFWRGVKWGDGPRRWGRPMKQSDSGEAALFRATQDRLH